MSTLSVSNLTGLSGITFGGTVSINATSVNATSANASSFTIGSDFTANSTVVNATSYNIGTVYSVNSTSINAVSGSFSVNSASIRHSSNTFTLGTSSATTANGYTYLPNGLIMQWGVVSSNSITGDITFPTPFPNALLSITATTVTIDNSSTHLARLFAANTTTANVRTTNTASRSVYYQAIGR